MNLSQRHILAITILSLVVLLLLWADKLYLKQVGLFDMKYELIKIILHTVVAYKLAKYLVRVLKLQQRIKKLKVSTVFLLSFLLLNSYIITQYSVRAISNKIINIETRNKLASRTIQTGYAGWGYECDSLNYSEYTELTKSDRIIDIPKESKLIFVHDWYEFDFTRVVEFNVPIDFDINNFYNNDTAILNSIREIKNGEYLSRISEEGYPIFHNTNILKIDTSFYKRYKYEISQS